MSEGKALCVSGSRADDGKCFDGFEEGENEVLDGICMSFTEFARPWTCGKFFGLEQGGGQLDVCLI